MPASTRLELRTQIRREIRDENESAYVFTDTELNTYIGNAIREYSKIIPREIKGSLALVDGQAEYDEPAGMRELLSIIEGDAAYTVTEFFGGKMTISPVPTAAATAVIKYLGFHTIPSDDTSASTYDEADEELIKKHVRAQCWEILAGDGARYYDYTEGDIRESQGKTQAQFRAEADTLYAEFNTGVVESAETRKALRAMGSSHSFAGKVSRAKPKASKTIYKDPLR